jgi:hypothetical protein
LRSPEKILGFEFHNVSASEPGHHFGNSFLTLKDIGRMDKIPGYACGFSGAFYSDAQHPPDLPEAGKELSTNRMQTL